MLRWEDFEVGTQVFSIGYNNASGWLTGRGLHAQSGPVRRHQYPETPPDLGTGSRRARFGGGDAEVAMRVLLGIILGAALTVGGAYVYDSHNALATANAPAAVQQPLVNWNVVGTKWQQLNERARSEWARLAG